MYKILVRSTLFVFVISVFFQAPLFYCLFKIFGAQFFEQRFVSTEVPAGEKNPCMFGLVVGETTLEEAKKLFDLELRNDWYLAQTVVATDWQGNEEPEWPVQAKRTIKEKRISRCTGFNDFFDESVFFTDRELYQIRGNTLFVRQATEESDWIHEKFTNKLREAIDFEGATHLLLAFADGILVRIDFQFDNKRTDDVFSILSAKYRRTSFFNPFVGGSKYSFESGEALITLCDSGRSLEDALLTCVLRDELIHHRHYLARLKSGKIEKDRGLF